MAKSSIKQRVLKLTGWTSAQYDKEYDILRNKVRQFEKITGRKPRNVANELFLRERERLNPDKSGYKIDKETGEIKKGSYTLGSRFTVYENISSRSTGKAPTAAAVNQVKLDLYARAYGFIESNKQAKRIWYSNEYSDAEKVAKIEALLRKTTMLRSQAREKLAAGIEEEFFNYEDVEIEE